MIDEITIERFTRDGAVLLKGRFTAWIDALRHGVDQVMAAPSALERSVRPAGSVPFFQDLCNWQRIPEFRDFVERSPAARIAATLMKSHEARFFHDHILVKEPGTAVATPWHQDLPYYCVDGPCNVSFWIPLDPVPRENSMECVAGSHAWGRIHKPKRFDGTDLYADDMRMAMPDFNAVRDAHEILGWELELGDAIAFHFGTIHGAPATTHSVNRRRVFSARWVGDGTVFVDRQGKGSPPFKHLTLRDGAPLEGPDFPLVISA
jgi:ectoine hydroxylase-related dioxygenase (phytanoyl-CoA dioxygenase family)